MGTTLVVTVTVWLAKRAHCPTSGVKLYTVVPGVAVFITAGIQIPVIPFNDILGSGSGVSPTQYSSSSAKSGVCESETSTESTKGEAHCPASGVKVYAVVPDEDVLITAGLHEPVTPLSEIPGNISGASPTQYSSSRTKSGAINGFTVTNMLTISAH